MWRPLKETDIEAQYFVNENRFIRKTLPIIAVIFGTIFICLLWLIFTPVLGIIALIGMVVLYILYGKQKVTDFLNKYLTVDINQCMVTDATVIGVSYDYHWDRVQNEDNKVYHIKLKIDDGTIYEVDDIHFQDIEDYLNKEVWLYCTTNNQLTKLNQTIDKINPEFNEKYDNKGTETLFIRKKKVNQLPNG